MNIPITYPTDLIKAVHQDDLRLLYKLLKVGVSIPKAVSFVAELAMPNPERN